MRRPPRIPGGFERGATQPAGMHRPSNAARLSPRAAKPSREEVTLSTMACNFCSIVALVITAAVVSSGSGQGDRAKLTGAFADVDRLFQDFTTQAHVPGA